MKISTACSILIAVLASALFGAAPSWSEGPLAPAVAEIPAKDVVSLPFEWRRLNYRARNLAGRFDAELSLLPAESADSGQKWRTELTTSMSSLWLRDTRTRIRAWFDGHSGAVSRFTKLSLGPRPDLKRYDFAPSGVTRVRTEPQAGEHEFGPERWSQVVENFFDVRGEEYGCRTVTEPSALLAVLTRSAGEAVRDPGACVFYGKTLYRLSLNWVDRSQVKVKYTLEGVGAPQERRDRIDSDRFDVIATPIAGDLDETAERYVLHVDARSRVPWKVVSPTGGIDFALVLSGVRVAPRSADPVAAPPPAEPVASLSAGAPGPEAGSLGG